MASKTHHDRIRKLMSEVETAAKRLRSDVGKRAQEAGLLEGLHAAADKLRKQAAAAAAHVEKYAHEVRKQLESEARKAPRKRAKRTAKR